jgi:hypothetical protein
MHYASIVVELLQDQYPSLLDCLHRGRTVSEATNQYASYLECHHESWIDRLSAKHADCDPNQIAKDALALAIEDLGEDISSSALTLNSSEGEALGLYAAMGYVRRAARSEWKKKKAQSSHSRRGAVAA